MKTTINEIFDYFPGNHYLTEEIIYQQPAINTTEAIPIYSGSENNQLPMNFICKDAVNKKGESIAYFKGPCIILTKDGSAGLLTLKQDSDEFTLNHHACVLRVKPMEVTNIDIEWFVYQFQSVFFDVCTSKSDNRVFSTEWFDRLCLEIPEYRVQLEHKQIKKFLDELIILIDNIKHKAELLLRQKIQLPESELSSETISTIFHCYSGNSGLTEEFIYNNSPKNDDDKVEIITSATQAQNYMGYVSKEAILPNKKKIKIFNGETIIVTRNGYAGTISYIKDKIFTTNDHAYVLTLNPKWVNKINVEWFAYQYKDIFKNVITSKSDNATFNKEWLKKIIVEFPDKHIQDKNAYIFHELNNMLNLMDNYRNQIHQLIYTPIR